MGVKAVVAVDLGGTVRLGVDLLRRLELPGLEATLVNVVEPMLADGTFPNVGTVQPAGEVLADLRAAGEKACRDVAESLGSGTRVAAVESGFGDPSAIVSGIAKKHEADMIVVGSMRKGTFGSLFLGSVTKGLAVHGDRTVLIGKRSDRPKGKLTAVLATDHSEYMGRCLDRLLAFGPRGFARLHVVTATPPPPSGPHFAAEAGEDLIRAIHLDQERVVEMTKTVVARLSPIADDVSQEVTTGHPNEVISSAMMRLDADLLIIGAQGHGFLERLFVGSLALHQVVHEPHDLLLLRA